MVDKYWLMAMKLRDTHEQLSEEMTEPKQSYMPTHVYLGKNGMIGYMCISKNPMFQGMMSKIITHPKFWDLLL